VIQVLAGEGDGVRGRAMRVEETGLAVVHEGEWVVAADGDEATLRAPTAGPVVDVPITVEVTVPLSEADRRAIAALALRELRDAFEARGWVV
jgi:hypothetical protein